MTLSFIIAIIASVLAGMVWVFSIVAIVPYPKNPQSSALKQLLYQAIDWLDLDEAPVWRRILFKILFSVLIITALGCGFYDTYSSFAPENRNFLNAVVAVVISLISVGLIFIGCIGIMHPIETLTTNYFKLECCDTNRYGLHYKSRLRNCIILNSIILCIWIATFVICFYICNGSCAFTLITLSTILTAVLCIILAFLGCICLVLFLLIKHTIVIPFLCYIKWLKK